MKQIQILFLITTTFFAISCKKSNDDRPKTTEELRIELKLRESQNPIKYLKANNVTMQQVQKKVRNGGIFRSPENIPDGAIFEGDVFNSATLATFKDIQFKVSYYSKTKTLISEKLYTIYEIYPPNSTRHFSFKVSEIPAAYASYTFIIVAATSTN